jgi:hypothetical protein
MLINNLNPLRVYIGSSLNMGRRFKEYYLLTLGLRKVKSISEKEIANTKPNHWSVIILSFNLPILTLIEEQFAIFIWQPTINRTRKVLLNFNVDKIQYIKSAINLAMLYRKDFPKGSIQYIQFKKMSAQLKFKLKAIELKPSIVGNIGMPVFLYNYNNNELILIYNSIKAALQGLQISYDILMKHINQNLIFNEDFVISLFPLKKDIIKNYNKKPLIKKGMQTYINLLDSFGNIVHSFDSLRIMAKFFNMELKTLRLMIEKNKTFKGYTVFTLPKSRSLPVYVYDAKTLKQLNSYVSINETIKSVPIKFYTLKNCIEFRVEHKGFLFSHSDNDKF